MTYRCFTVWRSRRCLGFRVQLWCILLVAIAILTTLVNLGLVGNKGGSAGLNYDYSSFRKCVTPEVSSPIRRVEDSCVFVYSVFGHESRPDVGYFNVLINAWDGDHSTSQLQCCFIQEDGSTTSVQARLVNTFYNKPAPFRAVQFNCPLYSGEATLPSSVTLTTGSCSRQDGQRHKILRAEILPGEVGVCGKVAYGHLDPQRLAEWFEMQLILGVKKVLLYTFRLEAAAAAVLAHYADMGLLEMLPYDIPQTLVEKRDRGFNMGHRFLPQFLSDEQVSVFDCQERLAGMGYVLQLDLDELLLPHSSSLTLPELFKNELFGKSLRYPLAATFTFSVKFFITSWGTPPTKSDLFFIKYRERTSPRYECIKTVHLPDRIKVFYTHEAFPRSWYYFMYNVDPSIATVHHYRECPAKWPDCLMMPRYTDITVYSFGKMLEQRLKALPKNLSDLFR